jgi:microcystin-dependent protein
MRKRHALSALVGAALAIASSASGAFAQSDPFLGQVMIFGGNFCPRGWALMNGQLMPISQNQALFSLLGTTYGGDGRASFALPTAKPVFTGTGAAFVTCIALVGVFPARN